MLFVDFRSILASHSFGYMPTQYSSLVPSLIHGGGPRTGSWETLDGSRT